MKTKEEIVENWLPRYTGTELEEFGKYMLLVNFSRYLEMYAEKLKYLMVLGLAGIFSMPYMLFFNVISHIARPKADPYNE